MASLVSDGSVSDVGESHENGFPIFERGIIASGLCAIVFGCWYAARLV